MGLPIKLLPEMERPRERLLMHGACSLSNSELLAVVIGKGIKNQPATDLAKALLVKFGDVTELKKLSISEILSIKGLGLAKSCQLIACFELARRMSGATIIKSKKYTDSKNLYELVKPFLVSKDKEHFITVALDARKQLIAIDNISIGTVNQSLVHPREVFKAAINRRATYLVLAHNHPSGDPSPSTTDLTVTERLISVSYAMGIPIIDHIIVSDSGYTSFKDEEYIKS